MIIVRYSIGIVGALEGCVKGALILQLECRVEQCLVFGVAAGDHTEDPAGVVIVWQHLIHGLVDEIRHEVQSELKYFVSVASGTLTALLVCHAQRLKTLGKCHGGLALGETCAGDKGRASLGHLYLHWVLATLRASAELGVALSQTDHLGRCFLLLALTACTATTLSAFPR